jgi:hypothetical protein
LPFSALSQARSDRSRVLTAVEHSHDDDVFTLHVVIDRERETLGERAIQAPVRLGMNAAKQRQRIDIGEPAVEKVFPDASLLFLVERKTFQ